jgi:hypothetical protein
VVYAVLTWRLVSETRKLRRAQIEPNLLLYAEPTPHWINGMQLVLRNAGGGAAVDITFSVVKDLVVDEKLHISEQAFIASGIQYLPPSTEYRTFMMSMIGRDPANEDLTFVVESSYTNELGQRARKRHAVNLGQFAGMRRLDDSPISKIAKSVSQLQQDVQHVTTGFRQVRVETSLTEQSLQSMRRRPRRFRADPHA